MSFETIHIKSPAWLPDALKGRFSSERLVIRSKFSKAERSLLRKKVKIRVSDWAEKFRIVTQSALPGRWRNSTTPYLVGIMDACGFSSVREVFVCKTPQIGVSEVIHNFIGWSIDRNPGPTLYVYPDELSAKENMEERIIPMITSSSRLRRYLTGVADHVSMLRVKLVHMMIYLAWPRSPSRLGNKPIKNLVMDEVDKYPETASKKEASPIDLGRKRTTWFPYDKKIIEISTPTTETGRIWVALQTEAQVVFEYRVRCPECQGMQLMRFDQIKFPQDERNPEKIQNQNLAWYECEHCQEKWDDTLRDEAVALGEWYARGTETEIEDYLTLYRPKKIGFHLQSWISRFVSLSEVAAAFLKGKNDKLKLRDFMNAYKAEPWVDYGVDRQEGMILRLKDERPAGLVPRAEIALLSISIDTQQDGFYYEIRAWGYGLHLESWQIAYGYVESEEALEWILYETEYFDSNQKAYRIRGGFMDSGGTRKEGKKHSRTHEVYEFCQRNRQIRPIKGMQRQSQPWRVSHLDTYPNSNEKIPGGLQLYPLDVNYYKDWFSRKLEIEPTDPGAYHLHGAVMEDYAAQLCAEYQDDSGLWVCPSHKANHYWDCAVYGLAYVDMVKLKHWKKEKKKTSKAAKQTTKKGRW